MIHRSRPSFNRHGGFTFVELLMIVAVLGVMAYVLLPRMGPRSAARAQRIDCVNNLKQIGLSFRTWSLDNGDRFPMAVPLNEGGVRFGTMDFTNGINTYMHFLVMSNELSTPKILLCPEEGDPNRMAANFFAGSQQTPGDGKFAFKSNKNLSYFVGLDANENNPNQILAGDRNLTNGISLHDGVMDLRPGQPVGWQNSHHMVQGNIALSDGSVQQWSSKRFQTSVADNNLTNRLSMPVLSEKGSP